MTDRLPTTPASDTDPEKVVRRAWLSYIDRGWKGMLDHCVEDVCWISLLAMGRPANGREGIAAMFEGMDASGVSHVAAPYRYSVVNGRVVVSVDVCVTTGGVRDDDLQAFIVYHVEGGRITRLCEYVTPDDALAAARDD